MNRFRLLSVVWFAFLCNPAWAQVSVRGQIIDENGKGLPFASVYILSNPQVGTISNLSGEFSMQNVLPQDTLVVDYLGYEILKIPIQEMINSDNQIYALTQKSIEIPEIVITPEGVKDMIKEAYSKIADNYPAAYPIIQGIFRKQVVKDGEYSLFGECYLDLRYNSLSEIAKTRSLGGKQRVFNIRLSEDNFLNEDVYLSISPESIITPYPIFSPLYNNQRDNYIWTTEAILEKSGEQIMEISFKSKDASLERHGRIYVSIKDKAIVAIIDTSKTNLGGHNSSGVTTETNNSYTTMYAFYKKERDKWVLSYNRVDIISDIKYINKREPEKNFESPVIISYDYMTIGWKEISAEDSNFEKCKDPFSKPGRKYPKTEMSEFTKILPDYKF